VVEFFCNFFLIICNTDYLGILDVNIAMDLRAKHVLDILR